MENGEQKKPEECSKRDTSKEKEKSSQSQAEKEATAEHSVTDHVVLTKSSETSSESSTADKEKPEETLEENTSDSPFALQSLVDVPDFEFMGVDGSFQTPFY